MIPLDHPYQIKKNSFEGKKYGSGPLLFIYLRKRLNLTKQ